MNRATRELLISLFLFVGIIISICAISIYLGISSQRVHSIMILSVGGFCIYWGLYLRWRINDDEVVIVRDDISEYYDPKRMKMDAWRYLVILGIVGGSLSLISYFFSDSFILTWLLFMGMLVGLLFYSFMFNFKKYLKDPEIRPNVNFWGNTPKK